MLTDGLGDLNWLAVVLAAVAYFVFGALWYAPPVMGNRWMAARGVEAPEDANPNPMLFVVTFLGYLLAAIVIGLIALATGAETLVDGLVLGLVTGIGFAVTSIAITQMYEERPKNLIAINSIYNLLGYMLMGITIVIWQ